MEIGKCNYSKINQEIVLFEYSGYNLVTKLY